MSDERKPLLTIETHMELGYIYLRLTNNKIVNARRVSDRVLCEFDAQGEVVGIEIENG